WGDGATYASWCSPRPAVGSACRVSRRISRVPSRILPNVRPRYHGARATIRARGGLMPGAIDWPAVHAEALDILVRYLRIDTSNPPGNEAPAARFLGALLE